MATRKIVPRADGEGAIGTAAKKWGDGQFNDLHPELTSMDGTARWKKGGDKASAAALDISALDGNYFDVTGVNAITSITTSGQIGAVICLHFDGILTFTHHVTDLILPGGANITTAAGDEAILIEYDTGDWRCISYTKADGTPVVVGGLSNVVEDVTPQLGGELDAQAHSIGFTAQTAIGDGATTIDWRLGNKMHFTHGAMAEVFTFTAPSKPCNLIHKIKQDAVGGRDCTFPGSVTWLGSEPTWTDGGANKSILVAYYWDGTTYWAIGSPWEV